MRRLVAAAAAACTAIAVFAAPAGAHAIVRETRPAADQTVPTSPAVVVMRFNEPVEIAFGAIRVYDTNGKRVDDGDTRHAGSTSAIEVPLDDDLPDGTYTVTWRVVSADGHPIREAFVFHVGAPGERPQGIADELLRGEPDSDKTVGLLAGVFRFVLFASLMLLGGSVAFRAFVWQDDRAWRWLPWGLSFAGLSTAVLYVLQGALAAGVPLSDALDAAGDVAQTRYGWVTLLRYGALIACGALFLVPVVRRRPHLPPAFMAVPVLVALATPGLAGHAGTTSPVAVNVVADTVHMAAAAAWVGGLVVLWRIALPNAEDPAAVARRFSTLAVASVAALVVTGVWRSYVEVRELEAFDTAYGVVLLGKVGAFLPMVGIGYLNQRVLRAADGDGDVKTVKRNVALETLAAAVVLALTAMLVNLPPARTAAGGGIVQESTRLGSLRLDVLVTPGRVGENQVHLTAFTAAGAPAEIDSMDVLFTLPEEGIGPIPASATRLAPGHFVVQGRQLSVSGRWVLEVVAKTGRFTEERTKVTVRVA